MSRKLVYVAGPYTLGDVAENVRNAIAAGEEILHVGHAALVPHLTHFWHFLFPGPYEQWMALSTECLRRCDVLLRLPGESPGSDREVRIAEDLGIPVFHDVEAVISWLHKEGESC